ncbi:MULTISPECIES: hypothetical protein [Thermomonosporaceae]|uniref:hypothetical protein n=1 Tax=Thermomonosporaceae TaxID=2012 RepID=UPI00255B185B|nr:MULTISPECIES: hypothetical protein [Thermomonosporaceae]MDL4775122.1 hypothetical protein [Actinomadura xylanilytica]
MKALVRRIGTPTLAALAAIGLTAATASATTVHRDTAAGASYSGPYQITNIGALTISGSGITASCSGVDLRGDLTSSGTGTLTSASVTGCTSSLGNATVKFLNLPYTQGSLTQGNGPAGSDGKLTFSDPNLSIQATFSLGTCTYGFGGSTTSLSFNVFNRDNAGRPNSADDLQGQILNAGLNKTGGSVLCPGSATANGIGKARGKVTTGAATYDQKLYLTP